MHHSHHATANPHSLQPPTHIHDLPGVAEQARSRCPGHVVRNTVMSGSFGLLCAGTQPLDAATCLANLVLIGDDSLISDIHDTPLSSECSGTGHVSYSPPRSQLLHHAAKKKCKSRMLRCLEDETLCSMKHRLCSAYVGVAPFFTIPAELYQTSDIGRARFLPDFTSWPGLMRLLAANRCKNPRHLLIQPACPKLSGRANGRLLVIWPANTPCNVDFFAGKDRAIGQHYIMRQGRVTDAR